MIVVGIDPGLDGAYAVLGHLGEVLEAGVMPTYELDAKHQEVDRCRLNMLLLAWEPELVVIEKVGPVQGASLRSTWTFACAFDAALSVIQLNEWAHLRVRPQDWKAEVLTGTDKSKAAAIRYCWGRWPGVNLVPPGRRVPHDGIADALAMSEYGRRKGQVRTY